MCPTYRQTSSGIENKTLSKKKKKKKKKQRERENQHVTNCSLMYVIKMKHLQVSLNNKRDMLFLFFIIGLIRYLCVSCGDALVS